VEDHNRYAPGVFTGTAEEHVERLFEPRLGAV
jgi:hypothetical protein